jgi:translation initiation factor IF-2
VQLVRAQLMEHDIVVEDMGGETLVAEVSALRATGLYRLQQAILLQADLMGGLWSTRAGPVEAVIIESTMAQGFIIEKKYFKK